MTRTRVLLALGGCLAIASIQTHVVAQSGSQSRLPKGIGGIEDGQAKPPSANWLLDAKDDQERFRRIQIFAGGTYEQMWQIGYRYQQVYHAIADENWELGLHHWTKLRDVFNVALMKRPNRTLNAEAMFLDTAWKQLEEALEAKDARKGSASVPDGTRHVHGLSCRRENAVLERHADLQRHSNLPGRVSTSDTPWRPTVPPGKESSSASHDASWGWWRHHSDNTVALCRRAK